MKKEIFRVGTFTDANGKTKKFTETDLDEIVKNFDSSTSLNSEGRKVPLFLAHPSDESSAPALAWVKSVWKEGKSLFAEFEKITEDAKNAIKNFSFRDVSISIWKKILQHIGLTNTPAVSLLGDFQFKNIHKDASQWNFKEKENQMDEKKFFDKFKDFFKSEMSTHINKENQMDSKELEEKISSLEEKFSKQDEKFEQQQEEIRTVVAERDKFKSSYEESQKKIDELEKEKKAEKEAAFDKIDEQFCDSLIESGKMRPADKEFNLFQLKTLRESEKREFTVGDKKEEIKPVELFKKRLEAQPKFSELEELGEGAENTSDDKITQLAQKKILENNSLSFGAACREVLVEHPELDNMEGK